MEFCRLLRREGVTVTPSETIDAISVLPLIDLTRKGDFHDGLRAVLIKKAEDYGIFDRVFESFWMKHGIADSQSPLAGPALEVARSGREKNGPEERKVDRGTDRRGREARGEVVELFSHAVSPPTDQILNAYSAVERLGRREFANLSLSEVPQIRRGLRLLARRLATRPGRRMVRSRKGELDLDSTLRKSLQTGGAIIRPQRRTRAISRSRLVFLCDISGSMDAHATRLLKVLHLAQNALPETRVFAFSTRLTKMERYLTGRSLWNAAGEVSRNVEIWSSGTRIGAALGRLLREHSTVLSRDAVVVIISDGWEIGDLGLLAENLGRIRARVSRIVWLNPLADDPGYEPKTLGMRTALPYVDVFSGLNILSDRKEFRRILGRGIGIVGRGRRPAADAGREGTSPVPEGRGRGNI